MKKYKIKCYNCGNVDRFTIKEMSDLHFCQRCYKEHDTMCDVFANSVLELEKQNKRYREALELLVKQETLGKDVKTGKTAISYIGMIALKGLGIFNDDEYIVYGVDEVIESVLEDEE